MSLPRYRTLGMAGLLLLAACEEIDPCGANDYLCVPDGSYGVDAGLPDATVFPEASWDDASWGWPEASTPDASEQDASEPEDAGADGGSDGALEGGADGSLEDASTELDAAPDGTVISEEGGIDGSLPDASATDASEPDASLPDASLPDASLDDGGLAPLAKPLPSGQSYPRDWTWVPVPGSKCRDGSTAGYYWRRGTSSAVMVYLNGGGACADSFFCGLNPVNVNQDLPIELLIGGTPNLLLGPNADRQLAPDEGVFKRDPRNPVADWNMIYVPYCTGDIHSGSKPNGTVPGVNGPQQFVGYTNLGLFLDSFGPSFANAERVLLTGSSAGGFGSLLNFDRFQMYFDQWDIEVMAISDSGLPFRDQHMAPCLQKRWRDTWNLNAAFPAECTECFKEAGGLTEAAFNYYFGQKYKDRMLGGLITTVNDQIIRAFFAAGLNQNAGQPDNCTLDPGLNTIASALFFGQYSGDKYRQGLADVADNLVAPEQMGYYAMAGENHMHLWRPRFFQKNGNAMSIAEWMADILAKKPTKQGDQFLHP